MTVTAVLTLTVHDQTVFAQAEAEFLGFFVLALFNDVVLELHHQTALDADHMIVMVATLQFEYGMAAFKMVAAHQASGLKLSQYTVNGGQTDIVLPIKKLAVNVFGRHMPCRAMFQHFEDFEARQRYFEASVTKV